MGGAGLVTSCIKAQEPLPQDSGTITVHFLLPRAKVVSQARVPINRYPWSDINICRGIGTREDASKAPLRAQLHSKISANV